MVTTGLTSLRVWSLAISPAYATDQTLFASNNDGVVKSTSGGASWTTVSTGLTSLNNNQQSLAISPAYATDQTLFAGSRDGVFKSTSGGESWTAVMAGFTSPGIISLAVSPAYATDQTLFAGTDDGVFKSTSGGASWTAVNAGLTHTYIRDLAVSPAYATDQTLFAGGYGLFKSTSGGESWTPVNAGLTNFDITSLAISPAYATDQTLYAGAYYSPARGGGVFKSGSSGASWTAMSTGLTDLDITCLAISPAYATDQTLFAGNYHGGAYIYTDRAQAPTITSFAPASGVVGTSVTLTGSGFTGASAVSFNGAAATSFTVVSDTQITATVPTGASTGTIAVSTAGGTGTSTSSFTVRSAPVTPTVTLRLSGLTAGAISLGQIVTATGTVAPLSLVGSRVTLTVQMKKGVAWVKVKTTTASSRPAGNYRWKYAPAGKGAYRMRAQVAATAAYGAATTPWRAFTVK